MSNECPHGRITCRGHKRYRGGIMDGNVQCLTMAHPSDYPVRIGTLLRQGQRSWYERETDPSDGTDVSYRFIGLGSE